MWNPDQMTPIGKTFAEIDAEHATYVKAANEALASARGQRSRWWSFMVSHCTFELVVGDAEGKDNIVLCLAGCRNISGPVSWPNQQLKVVWHNDSVERRWDYILSDETVGFCAEAGVLRWERNYDLLEHGSLYCPRESQYAT
jgi:hypothetical protein